MGLTNFSFTPSELILLRADKCAPEAKEKDAHQLLCSDGTVDGTYLATMILAAAILANVEENALKMEIRQQKKKLFSSRANSHIYISPIGQAPAWNSFTLEAAVLFTAGQFFAVQGEYTVQNVVQSILLEDRKQPWKKIVDIVEWGLASSNWLLPVEGEALSVFSTPFICPEKVRALAFEQPLDPIKQLFSDCKKSTPDLWKIMLEEINQAFQERQL